jgi:two-component system, LytTR family, response regulator
MRTLIVDDEPIARQVLREELERFGDIEIAGEAANGQEALLKIAELHPDLVFLDLQMPVLSGFEVIQNLAAPPAPFVIIVTAFDQHAIQAFEAGAIDYLLKPVSESRLQRAIERARSMQGKQAELASQLDLMAASAKTLAPAGSRKIIGRTGAEYHILNSEDVLAFQAERELVWIVTARQRILATQSLRAIESRLDSESFQRVHRNAIVNVNHIRKMTALSSQRWLVTLSNSQQLVVSKRQAHHIRQILNR